MADKTFALHAEGSGDPKAARALADQIAQADGVRIVTFAVDGQSETVRDDDALRRHFDHGKVAMDELERLLNPQFTKEAEFGERIYGAIETAKSFGLQVDEKRLETRRKGVMKYLTAGRKLNAPTPIRAARKPRKAKAPRTEAS